MAGVPVIIIRPEPGASATLAAARAMGLDAHAFPLFAVRPLAWQAPPRDRFDALLIGSANVLRHGGAALGHYRGMPAYVVGETTAQSAREAGFDVVAVGSGGLQGVLDAIDPAHARLLRLAGRERVPLTLPSGASMETREVYASEPEPLPPSCTAMVAHGALVLLHSGEAAAHFALACDRAGLDRMRLALATLGPRIAARAGAGWGAVRCADSATDAALLALANEMCQEAPWVMGSRSEPDAGQ